MGEPPKNYVKTRVRGNPPYKRNAKKLDNLMVKFIIIGEKQSCPQNFKLIHKNCE
jgi:hypothetical protein